MHMSIKHVYVYHYINYVACVKRINRTFQMPTHNKLVEKSSLTYLEYLQEKYKRNDKDFPYKILHILVSTNHIRRTFN